MEYYLFRFVNMKKESGFTIIELMIVVVVLAIAASIAVPSFSSFVIGNKIEATSDKIIHAMQHARSEASQHRKEYLVKLDLLKNNLVIPSGTSEKIVELNDVRVILKNINNNEKFGFKYNGAAVKPLALLVCMDNHPEKSFFIEVEASGIINKYPRGEGKNGPIQECK